MMTRPRPASRLVQHYPPGAGLTNMGAGHHQHFSSPLYDLKAEQGHSSAMQTYLSLMVSPEALQAAFPLHANPRAVRQHDAQTFGELARPSAMASAGQSEEEVGKWHLRPRSS